MSANRPEGAAGSVKRPSLALAAMMGSSRMVIIPPGYRGWYRGWHVGRSLAEGLQPLRCFFGSCSGVLFILGSRRSRPLLSLHQLIHILRTLQDLAATTTCCIPNTRIVRDDRQRLRRAFFLEQILDQV